MASLAEAKATLLRALDQLDQAERDLERPVDDAILVVVYDLGHRDADDNAMHNVSGWAATTERHWVHEALLFRAAEALSCPVVAVDDEPDEDDGHDG